MVAGNEKLITNPGVFQQHAGVCFRVIVGSIRTNLARCSIGELHPLK